MTECFGQLDLGILHRKPIEGRFDAGDISSDGGLMLLAQVDAELGLLQKLSDCLTDTRDPSRVVHSTGELCMQRVYQILGGYEDCNDADDLRHDPVLKLCVGRLPDSQPALASQPTLSRFENSIGIDDLWAMSDVFIDVFILQYADSDPKQIILDFDATDDPTHGQQQLTGFHAYYKTHCYLPLIVTAQVDGGPHELLTTLLRKGKCHAGHRATAVLKLLVKRLRAQWPSVQIVIRGDSGFAKPRLYDWCERNGVKYLIGLVTNPRLVALGERYMEIARAEYAETGEKVRHVHEGPYKADSWPYYRRVLIKSEVMDNGENPRFVVTNLDGLPGDLYDLYAMRGDMENRIKELKRDLAMDRTSCHRFVANQFRLFLHGAAFVLMSFLRKLLAGTELATAQVCTLQRKLIKVGVLVGESVRRVRLAFASSYPLQHIWRNLLIKLRRLRPAESG
jgi:hypothetical protein